MKSKILLLTTMLTSASFAFAQTSTDPQTVVYKGITFEILEGSGNTSITTNGIIGTNKPKENATYTTNCVSVETTQYKVITGQRRQVNVKAIAINEQVAQSGQILYWSNSTPAPQLQTLTDYNTNINQFGKEAKYNRPIKYTVNNKTQEYKNYEAICLKASQNTSNPIPLVKGCDIPTDIATKDKQNVPIHQDLYYYETWTADDILDENGNQQFDEYGDLMQDVTFTYEPITRTTGGIYEETRMDNCYDDYTPTEISEDLAWNVTTSGKVGIVSGVVNNARIAEAIARNERNFDFTNTLILGEINVNVPANKLAYFPTNTEATGANIVIDLNCNNYLTKDNGEEIYVKEGFTAKRATYERKFTPNTYGTIVLPFAASTDQNDPFFEKLAQLTGYDSSTDVLTFTNTYESIVANRPYLYRLQDEAPESIKAINVNVGATPSKVASGTYNGATMYGTFQKLSYEQIQGKFGISADGGIVNAKEGASLKPGRAYLDLPPFPANSAKTFTIELVDEDGSYELIEVTPSETTAIEGTIADAKVVSTQYIAIDGTVSTTPHKGMNIVKKTLEDGTIQTSKVAF